MPSRKDLKKQKEKTTQSLIKAAFQLCWEEGYASLSLRSVARKAGIAPTSFSRHFREIDEMGVEMVAQAKEILDDCVERAQKKMMFPGVKKDSLSDLLKSIECITKPFVETFADVMGKHNQLVHLFFQEQTGSSKALRDSISDAKDQLTDRLAETLTQLITTPKIAPGDIKLISETMMMIVSRSVMETLVQPEVKAKDISKYTIKKLNLLLLGALTRENNQ